MFNVSYISKQSESLQSNLVKQARSQLDYITQILKEILHPSKIIVFGSINEKDRFHRHSDIDIAVLDIDEDKYFQAYGEILSKSHFPIDLIIMGKAKKTLREKILATGEVIYERKG